MSKKSTGALSGTVLVVGNRRKHELEVLSPGGSDSGFAAEPALRRITQSVGAELVGAIAARLNGSETVSTLLHEPPRRRTLLQTIGFVTSGDAPSRNVLRVTATRGSLERPATGSRTAADRFKVPKRRDVIVIYVPDLPSNELTSQALKVMAANPSALFVYRWQPQVARDELLARLIEDHPARSVLIVDADELRLAGMSVSRHLSWERTATDMAWQLGHHPWADIVGKCAAVVVLFDLDGALLYRPGGKARAASLIYDPGALEEDFRRMHPGVVPGTDEAVVGCLAAGLATDGVENIAMTAMQALSNARRLHSVGYGDDPSRCRLQQDILQSKSVPGKRVLRHVPVPVSTDKGEADPEFWQLTRSLAGRGLDSVAVEIVKAGHDLVMDQVPTARFGYLKTFDRGEIEGYRSICNLMDQYISCPGSSRPLSIAVFGPPGSGKSFGVTQIAESIAPGEIRKLEFNLSQFASRDDLVAAFHNVRDVTLDKKLPLVFFDEFDSDLNGTLGWLKYFLSPMQDGEFRDREQTHPIGRAIFVFAGGTADRFETFSREPKSVEITDRERKEFAAAKGPDFLSRLRGYVDIKGPNPVGTADSLFILRRALILRFQLTQSAPHLCDERGRISIDDGVLRALLKVRMYKHGVRSIAAIIEMSRLAGRRHFDQSALPSAAQLKLHVDPSEFLELARLNILWHAWTEELAMAVHARFRKDREKDHDPNDVSMRPWSALPEHLRKSNRAQAADIPRKMEMLGYEMHRSRSKQPRLAVFTEEETEEMAREEHRRYVRERKEDHWTAGERDPANKVSPYLVDWDDLPDDVKKWDYDAVRMIPKVLQMAGFEVRTMK